MKKLFLIIIIMVSFSCSSSSNTVPEMGDIIFQTSKSSQSDAIAEATDFKYTHVGIIIIQNNKAFVFETSSKVQLTPFNSWVDAGKNGKYKVKRLIDSHKFLTSQVQLEMFKVMNNYTGKDYDIMFQWSDDTVYCSELVWKMFRYGAGIELCPLKTFGDYNLNGKLMKNLIDKRYGGILNKREKVIAPADIYNSKLLYDVKY